MCLSSQQKADHSSCKILSTPPPPPFSFPTSSVQVGRAQRRLYCTCAVNVLWLQSYTWRCGVPGKSLLVTGYGLSSDRAMHPWNGIPPLGLVSECAQIHQGRESALAQ